MKVGLIFSMEMILPAGAGTIVPICLQHGQLKTEQSRLTVPEWVKQVQKMEVTLFLIRNSGTSNLHLNGKYQKEETVEFSISDRKWKESLYMSLLPNIRYWITKDIRMQN